MDSWIAQLLGRYMFGPNGKVPCRAWDQKSWFSCKLPSVSLGLQVFPSWKALSQVLGVQDLLVGKKNHSLSCKNCKIRGGNNPKCNTKVSVAIGKIFLTYWCVVRLVGGWECGWRWGWQLSECLAFSSSHSSPIARPESWPGVWYLHSRELMVWSRCVAWPVYHNGIFLRAGIFVYFICCSNPST